MIHVGHKMKELRYAKKISPETMAHLLGYSSRQSIYDIERRRHLPTELLAKLATIFEVDVTVFGPADAGTSSNDVIFLMKENARLLAQVKKLESELHCIKYQMPAN